MSSLHLASVKRRQVGRLEIGDLDYLSHILQCWNKQQISTKKLTSLALTSMGSGCEKIIKIYACRLMDISCFSAWHRAFGYKHTWCRKQKNIGIAVSSSDREENRSKVTDGSLLKLGAYCTCQQLRVIYYSQRGFSKCEKESVGAVGVGLFDCVRFTILSGSRSALAVFRLARLLPPTQRQQPQL